MGTNEIEQGKIVEFDMQKFFKYLKPLGSGFTGDTHLLEDETTDMLFAFKKYAPKDETRRDEDYKRFVDEIKILFKISHPNIVRVYNYYLYPTKKKGYLQMEYVEGTTIDEYLAMPWGKNWNQIFGDVINAFRYLEQNDILHRDIRPNNILIDKDGEVKVIDFGFGKIIEKKDIEKNSIFLNWPVTEMPQEITSDGSYTHATEIYFIGKLFKKILDDNPCEIDTFNYNYIIDKMIKVEKDKRYQSFEEIYTDISEGIFNELDFSLTEKNTYRNFADELSNNINSFYEKHVLVQDIDTVIDNLNNVIRNHSLEKYIQDNRNLIRCFVSYGFTYVTNIRIETNTVSAFYKLLIQLPRNKQKNVLDNILTRLSRVQIEKEELKEDDLPF